MVYIKQNFKPLFHVTGVVEGEVYDENKFNIESRSQLKHEALIASKTSTDKRERELYDELYKSL